MQVIGVANQKGGVGKTTSTQALGRGLFMKGNRVLFVDMDPQCNLSYAMQTTGEATSYELITGRATASEAIQNTGAGDMIPASPALAGADLELSKTGKEYKLKEALSSLQARYDYIVIDTPPNLGILTINALTAADSVIITSGADVFSLQGIGQLYATIEAVRKYTNPGLAIRGILLTRYNARSNLSRDITELVQDTARQLNTFVYSTPIREGVAIREAQANQADIFTHAPRSKQAADYLAFIDELLERSGANE